MIEDTEWAKRFKRECPLGYAQAIELVSHDVVEVSVQYRTELGDPVWAIIIEDESMEEDETTSSEFWLDVFATKNEAIALCNEMKWKIVNGSPTIS